MSRSCAIRGWRATGSLLPGGQVHTHHQLYSKRVAENSLSSAMRESMTNFASGDRDQRNYSSCSIHRIHRDADSIGIRLWRGSSRRAAARVLHSAGSRRAAGGLGVDYHRRHRCRSGLEAHPFAKHRLARIFHSLRHSTGAITSNEQPSKDRQRRTGNHHPRVLDLFFSRSRTTRTEAR